MTPTRQVLVILPLLVAPLAFSVALGGAREGTGTPTEPPAPAAMRGPKADSPRAEPEAAPAPRPSRLVRDEAARGAARSTESPAEQRSESLVGLRNAENAAEDVPAEFSPIKDRAETEQMKVAATAASALDDYGAAGE